MNAHRAHRQQAAREHLTRRHASHPDPESGSTLSNLPAVGRTGRITDPATHTPEEVRAALALVDAARLDLDRAELALIQAARAAGCSWEAIAGELGLDSRQAALRRRDRLRQRLHPETAPTTPAPSAVNKPLTTVEGDGAADPPAALRARTQADPSAAAAPDLAVTYDDGQLEPVAPAADASPPTAALARRSRPQAPSPRVAGRDGRR